MGKGQEKGYWDKRVLKDKARDVNNDGKVFAEESEGAVCAGGKGDPAGN